MLSEYVRFKLRFNKGPDFNLLNGSNRFDIGVYEVWVVEENCEQKEECEVESL